MKNNMKKAPVYFREDLLYFQQIYADFCLCPKLVIITTLSKHVIISQKCKYIEMCLY